MATRTLEHLTVMVSFSSYFGANLPSASRTLTQRMNSTPVTLPFLPIMRFGPQQLFMTTPSAMPAFFSSGTVGISSSFSRQ